MQYQFLNGENVAEYLEELKITEQGRGSSLNELVKNKGGYFKISKII